jgi:hypothetical protein
MVATNRMSIITPKAIVPSHTKVSTGSEMVNFAVQHAGTESTPQWSLSNSTPSANRVKQDCMYVVLQTCTASHYNLPAYKSAVIPSPIKQALHHHSQIQPDTYSLQVYSLSCRSPFVNHGVPGHREPPRRCRGLHRRRRMQEEVH